LPNAARLVTIGVPYLETSIKALELGADAVFSKPVSPEQLIMVIDKITQKIAKEPKTMDKKN
jgi:DNA-binding response OmpR family regulator